MNEELEVEKANQSVCCVVLSVRVWFMCCGSVQPIVIQARCKHNNKTAYVLGSELRECDFDDLLSLVKEYVVGVWDAHKYKLYGDDSCPSQLQSLAEDLQLELRGKWMVSYVPQVREEEMVRICHVCVWGSAHDCGCMVDGSNAMVAS